MAKSIITQEGNIVNYSNLLAIYVDEDRDDNGNLLGYELLGTDNTQTAIVLGSFADERSAEKTKADLIRWLQGEAFSTFEMPVAEESGDH